MSEPRRPRTGGLSFTTQRPAASPAKQSKPAAKPAAAARREEDEEAKDPYAYRKNQKTVYIEKHLHREAQKAALNQGVTLKEFVEALIKKALKARGVHDDEDGEG